MKAFAVIGTSMIGKMPFVTRLIEAYRFDGWSVSVIKHAPDGFDADQPGKASLARREAGTREVMLVGDRRLVIFDEYGGEPRPPLEALMERLAPVDLVIVEGYHDTVLPTLEIYRPDGRRSPRYAESRHVVAVASDEPLDVPLPSFALDDTDGIADFMAAKIGLVSRGRLAGGWLARKQA
jgi:molybdopterin-guanine dinucleotide biosynthesis adapter protein